MHIDAQSLLIFREPKLSSSISLDVRISRQWEIVKMSLDEDKRFCLCDTYLEFSCDNDHLLLKLCSILPIFSQLARRIITDTNCSSHSSVERNKNNIFIHSNTIVRCREEVTNEVNPIPLAVITFNTHPLKKSSFVNKPFSIDVCRYIHMYTHLCTLYCSHLLRSLSLSFHLRFFRDIKILNCYFNAFFFLWLVVDIQEHEEGMESCNRSWTCELLLRSLLLFTPEYVFDCGCCRNHRAS